MISVTIGTDDIPCGYDICYADDICLRHMKERILYHTCEASISFGLPYIISRKRYIIEKHNKLWYNAGERKENGEMKLFKAGTLQQIVYCFCCLIVVICMPLYTAFYMTAFGSLCFKIGAGLTLLSTFNPIGLIGTIMNFIGCFSTDLKKSKKHLIWTIVSPVVIVCSWVLAVLFFVHHSGGV